MADLEEKFISTERLLDAKIIKVRRDKVASPKGECYREVVEHNGGVVILPFLDESNIIFIKQWRHPVGKALIELPAGKLEEGEVPFECAKRELTEETGFEAKKWKSLGYIYTTPGFCSEKLHLYMASELEFVGTKFDEFETIQNQVLTVQDAINMVKSGEITDAKTISALFFAKY